MEYSNYKGKNIAKYSTGGIIGSTLSGAGTGAGIGTMIMPGIGTAIGAGVGLLGGLVSGLFKNSAENKQKALQERNTYMTNEQAKSLDDAGRFNNYYTNGYDQETLYNKGGMIITRKNNGVIKNNNISKINTSSNTRRIGDGIQVTGNNGKDKINATVDGTPVKLDNNEIVVQYHGSPIVISDDLGEADRYRAELKAGGSPKRIADKYALRAIMLKHNNDNHLAEGGGIPLINQFRRYNNYKVNNIYTPNINKVGYNSSIGKIGYNALTNPNGNSTFDFQNSYNQPINQTPIISNYSSPQTTTPVNNYIPTATTTFANTVDNLNYPTVQPLSLSSRSLPTNTSISGNLDPTFIKASTLGGSNNNSGGGLNSNAISGIAQGATALGSIISNISANAQLQKTNIPRPYLPQFVNRNIDANAPMFEHQIHNLDSTIGNLNKNVLNNTSNSNVALARLNSLEGKKLNAQSSIYSNQIADRNRIENSNIAQQNNFNLNNANTMNRYDSQVYASNIGKIQSNLALAGSTLSTINGVINNMKKDKYQNEQLQAIAKQVGFNPNGNFNASSLDSMQQAQLAKLLKQAGLTQ